MRIQFGTTSPPRWEPDHEPGIFRAASGAMSAPAGGSLTAQLAKAKHATVQKRVRVFMRNAV
ncbi:MAG: hypothetical protein ABIS29_12550 [Vicinamibacterales bacterium]